MRNICLILVTVLALSLTACSREAAETGPSPAATETAAEAAVVPTTSAAADADDGLAHHFSVNVTHCDGSAATYEIHTDSTTVGDALVTAGLIDGTDSEYGLYVITVDGETLDYDTDGMYWAFYIDGTYANTGVDSTDITDGAVYEFKAEK